MIEFLLINAMVITGIYAVTEPGQIAGFLHTYKPIWALKPVFGCMLCMSSVWGIAGFCITPMPWELLPIYVFALAGIMAAVSSAAMIVEVLLYTEDD